MPKIGKLWAGGIAGTNTGKVFAEFEQVDDDQIKGTIRVRDDQFGLSIYAVSGTFDGSKLHVTGTFVQTPEGIATGDITVDGALSPSGELRGQWSSTLGTAGTFALFPHSDVNIPQQSTLSSLLPERIHTAVRNVGAVRLYADDVRNLIGFVARDFSNQRVIVTYIERGNEVIRYADDFEKDIERLGELTYLRLGLQEPEAYGINRLANVTLNANGVNEVRVQGVQESWVTGKAETLATELRRYQQTLATGFRKWGLNVNNLLALIAIALLPDLNLRNRVIFLAIIWMLNTFIGYLHTRYIPNAVIYLSPKRPAWFQRAAPQIWSWVIAATAAIFAALVYGYMIGEVKLHSIIHH